MFSLSEWQVSSSILEEERGGATPWKPGRGKVLEEDEEGEDGPGESNRGRVGGGRRIRSNREDEGPERRQRENERWRQEPEMDMNEREGQMSEG